jgi:hypothetical protein
MPIRRLIIALTSLAAFAAVAGASGEPVNAYTATGTPQFVKPSTARTYTVSLTNDAQSPQEADRAKIGIPAGFVVAGASVQASASAASSCVASTWVADGMLIANGKINLKRPGGGGGSGRLCPGATLTVVFSATSSAVEGNYVWTTELLRDTTAYLLNGSQPTVVVDGTAPAVTLTSRPPDPSNDTSPSFGFSANEPAGFECKLDNGSFGACTSPKGYSNLVDGSHTFAVKATDPAGNTGPTVSYTWLLETTLPIVTLTEKPSPASNSSAATFSFTTSKPASVQCKLDGGAFAPCSSPAGFTGLGDGPHSFTAKATDGAMNTGPETTYSWTIDTAAPTTSIISKPANLSNDPTPTFSFSANEAGATFQCKLDDGAFAACSSPRTYDPGPGDGPHTFLVRARDAAGNTGTAANSAWTIDTVAPVATINEKPNDPSGVASAAFAFSAGEQATFKCRLDVGSFGTCTSPKAYSNLTDGVHTFTLTATDAAGNTSEELAYSWLVETVLPVVTLTAQPSSPSNRADASFSFTVNKAATFECRLDGSAFSSCTSPKAYTGLADAAHTFAVRGVSVAGTGPETVYNWSIDTVGPASAITAKPSDPTNQRSAVFAFAAGEQPATFQCKLDDAAYAACAPPQTYGNLADGRHSFVVRAIDSVSNVGAETAYQWTIENRAPAVTLTSVPTSLSSSALARLAFSADEPATFQCSLDDRAFEPCSSPASYASLGDGGHGFSVRATDLAGNVGSASYSWTVDATPPQTRIDSRPAARTAATSAVFAFSARGSSTFQCRLDAASFSRCASPRSYKRLAAGGHRFAVRAIDAAGNIDPTPSTAAWTVLKSGSSRSVASTALFAPKAGARVTKPPLLRWRVARGATYYNVQLFRSGRKVLSAWPTRTALQLQSPWRFSGRTMRLSAGSYQWYVWPGYGRPSARRYGRLLGTSTFVVGRPARP